MTTKNSFATHYGGEFQVSGRLDGSEQIRFPAIIKQPEKHPYLGLARPASYTLNTEVIKALNQVKQEWINTAGTQDMDTAAASLISHYGNVLYEVQKLLAQEALTDAERYLLSDKAMYLAVLKLATKALESNKDIQGSVSRNIVILMANTFSKNLMNDFLSEAVQKVLAARNIVLEMLQETEDPGDKTPQA